MSKTEFTASARVRVTVEVLNLGPYGADWKAGDIHDQVAREAQQKVERSTLPSGFLISTERTRDAPRER